MLNKPLSILIIVLYVGYPIISFILVWKNYQKLVLKNRRISILFLTLLALLNGILIALLGIYSYGLWWFFMIPLYLLPPIIGLFAAILSKNSWQEINSLKPIRFVFSLFFTLSFLLSPLLSFEIENLCDSFTRTQANFLISGIEQYQKEQGSYPEKVSMVYPSYVKELPTPTCLKPYKLFGRYYRDYTVEYCEDQSLLLTVHSQDLDNMLIYNFSYQQWTYYDSFEYCGCECPEVNKPRSISK